MSDNGHAYPPGKIGRPLIGDKPATGTERKQRQRARLAEEERQRVEAARAEARRRRMRVSEMQRTVASLAYQFALTEQVDSGEDREILRRLAEELGSRNIVS